MIILMDSSLSRCIWDVGGKIQRKFEIAHKLGKNTVLQEVSFLAYERDLASWWPSAPLPTDFGQ
jgi:hypothetical protein